MITKQTDNLNVNPLSKGSTDLTKSPFKKGDIVFYTPNSYPKHLSNEFISAMRCHGLEVVSCNPRVGFESEPMWTVEVKITSNKEPRDKTYSFSYLDLTKTYKVRTTCKGDKFRTGFLCPYHKTVTIPMEDGSVRLSFKDMRLAKKLIKPITYVGHQVFFLGEYTVGVDKSMKVEELLKEKL